MLKPAVDRFVYKWYQLIDSSFCLTIRHFLQYQNMLTIIELDPDPELAKFRIHDTDQQS